ncbi:GNAT family N-acetyltransferase [Roseovarius nanhaiticus]|uniref:GNAT family N-acetyltransferase n=1 Tax=Roseovarius nanhaiticus TaxID=573024 RepID=UPI0024924F3D|nr:GNAT family N-acetyltransferase [Roseovarius nanhaiticus]
MTSVDAGRRYIARIGAGAADLAAAQALRGLAFGLSQADGDGFDEGAVHVLIEDRREGILAACFRLGLFVSGIDAAESSYSAQFYDLARLTAFPGPMTELGRFCVRPGARDPDILRVAWGAITAHVDAGGITFLFGCTSFAGTDPKPYSQSFAALAAQHLAPRRFAPARRAAQAVPLARSPSEQPGDGIEARMMMPPLLRSYLGMGGWVSDHAVIDPAMNTIHVFTGLEIARIPEARKRRLRSTLDGAAPAR